MYLEGPSMLLKDCCNSATHHKMKFQYSKQKLNHIKNEVKLVLKHFDHSCLFLCKFKKIENDVGWLCQNFKNNQCDFYVGWFSNFFG